MGKGRNGPAVRALPTGRLGKEIGESPFVALVHPGPIPDAAGQGQYSGVPQASWAEPDLACAAELIRDRATRATRHSAASSR